MARAASSSAVDVLETLDIADWSPSPDAALARRIGDALESGKVLFLPRLAFRLQPQERRFLDPRWSDGRAKNISYDPQLNAVKGAIGNRTDLNALRDLIARFHRQAVALVERLLPPYAPHLYGARTSLRLFPVGGRATSWRKDDSRLHVDAFPSQPNRGERILRVFANVAPDGQPRVWRVGEPFADVAARLWPRLKPPLPGAAAALAWLRVTRTRRSAYDHYMLALHDAMKADARYQREAPQQTVAFPAPSVWICFSDQTAHAALSGQYLLEQTLHLPVAAMIQPARSPLRILERLAGKSLV